ncbi:MAG: efflux RND transporter permease subunit, partial [Holosporaceae bacterium]
MVKKDCFAHIFIDRPVLAWVLNIILIILGCVAYFYLAVSQYPQVYFPVMTGTPQCEGASP